MGTRKFKVMRPRP